MVNRLNKIQDTGRLSFETLSNWDKGCYRCSYTLHYCKPIHLGVEKTGNGGK